MIMQMHHLAAAPPPTSTPLPRRQFDIVRWCVYISVSITLTIYTRCIIAPRCMLHSLIMGAFLLLHFIALANHAAAVK